MPAPVAAVQLCSCAADSVRRRQDIRAELDRARALGLLSEGGLAGMLLIQCPGPFPCPLILPASLLSLLLAHPPALGPLGGRAGTATAYSLSAVRGDLAGYFSGEEPEVGWSAMRGYLKKADTFVKELSEVQPLLFAEPCLLS